MLIRELELNRNPFLKISGILILGLFLLSFLKPNTQLLYFIALFSLGGFISFLILKLKRIALLTGIVLICLLLQIEINNYFIDFKDEFYPSSEVLVKGEVKKLLNKSKTGNSYLVNCNIRSVKTKINNININLFVFGEETYKPGDIISGLIKITPSRPRQISDDFPERSFLISNKSYLKGFTSSNKIQFINRDADYFSLFSEFRSQIQNDIQYKFNDNTSPIIEALLIGNKSNISKNIKDSFALTGTSHLLAVSGLHIGLFSIMIWFFLGWLHHKWIKFGLFSLLLLGVILITGLQDSAIRAGLMAMIYVLVQNLGFRKYIMNIFCLAIFLFLVFNPVSFYSISFQLSASAVFGIIAFYKPLKEVISKFHSSKNTFINYTINSLSISFLASLFTLPVSTYYFGTIPIYTLFSNFVNIPIISLTLIYSMLSFTPFIGGYFVTITELLVRLSIIINNFILQIPGAYLSNNWTFLISIISVMSFIYLVFSNNFKRLIIRSCISILVITLVFNLDIKIKQYIKRENYSAIMDKKEIYIKEYIIGRSNNYDKAFESYLNKTDQDIYCFEPAYIFSESFYLQNKNRFKK